MPDNNTNQPQPTGNSSSPSTPATPPTPPQQTPSALQPFSPSALPPKPRENLLLNLAANILLPVLVLSKLSPDHLLGPIAALLLALAFPAAYFIYDYRRRREANFISILGFTGVLLTGVLGLLKADPFWFAVKEASIPSLIAIGLYLTRNSPRSLFRSLFLNDQVFNLPAINASLDTHKTHSQFDRAVTSAGTLFTISFLISAVLNYALARYLLTAPGGTPEFNAQLAQMNLLSWPVIVVPSTLIAALALWRLFSQLTKLTGLPLDSLIHPKPSQKN